MKIKIKEFRTQRGQTQAQFAEFLGLKQTSLSGYENGNREMSYDVMLNMADKLNISLDDLFGRAHFNTSALKEYQRELFDIILECDNEQCLKLIGYAHRLEKEKMEKEQQQKIDKMNKKKGYIS